MGRIISRSSSFCTWRWLIWCIWRLSFCFFSTFLVLFFRSWLFRFVSSIFFTHCCCFIVDTTDSLFLSKCVDAVIIIVTNLIAVVMVHECNPEFSQPKRAHTSSTHIHLHSEIENERDWEIEWISANFIHLVLVWSGMNADSPTRNQIGSGKRHLCQINNSNSQTSS